MYGQLIEVDDDKTLIKTYSFTTVNNPQLEMSTKAQTYCQASIPNGDGNFGTPTSVVPNIDCPDIPSYV